VCPKKAQHCIGLPACLPVCPPVHLPGRPPADASTVLPRLQASPRAMRRLFDVQQPAARHVVYPVVTEVEGDVTTFRWKKCDPVCLQVRWRRGRGGAAALRPGCWHLQRRPAVRRGTLCAPATSTTAVLPLASTKHAVWNQSAAGGRLLACVHEARMCVPL
jgi:hypothetical protein